MDKHGRTTLVKNGDVILIKKGMKVFAPIPLNMIEKTHPFQDKVVLGLVEIGKIYHSNPYSINTICSMIKNFVYEEFNADADYEVVDAFVSELPIDYEEKIFDSSIYEGEYIVTNAHYLEKRIIPYHVTCSKRDNPKICISFYQNTPMFSGNISEEIEVIGHINE